MEMFKEVVKESSTPTVLVIFGALLFANMVWFILKGIHPVWAGVGLGYSISVLLSNVHRAVYDHMNPVIPARGIVVTDASSKDALDVLAGHGLRAHYYSPAAGIEDIDFANAVRMVNSAGYIITYKDTDHLFGKVVTLPMTSAEAAEIRRAEFKVVK